MRAKMDWGAHAPRVLFPAPRRKVLKAFGTRNDVFRTSSDHGESTRCAFPPIKGIRLPLKSEISFCTVFCMATNVVSMTFTLHA